MGRLKPITEKRSPGINRGFVATLDPFSTVYLKNVAAMIPAMIARIPTVAINSTGPILPKLQKANRRGAGRASSLSNPTFMYNNPLVVRFLAARNLH